MHRLRPGPPRSQGALEVGGQGVQGRRALRGLRRLRPPQAASGQVAHAPQHQPPRLEAVSRPHVLRRLALGAWVRWKSARCALGQLRDTPSGTAGQRTHTAWEPDRSAVTAGLPRRRLHGKQCHASSLAGSRQRAHRRERAGVALPLLEDPERHKSHRRYGHKQNCEPRRPAQALPRRFLGRRAARIQGPRLRA